MSPDAIVARVHEMGGGRVLDSLAREYLVPSREIVGTSRFMTCTAARHRLWFILRSTLNLSYPELGAMFDRDHTTIMAGCRKAEEIARVALGVAA